MNIQIIEKPDWISWEEITDLLHQAFAEHQKNGLHYQACDQSVEITRERAKNAICLVALQDKKLVGTGLVRIYEKKGKKYGYFNQLAVLPGIKGLGIGTKINEERKKICIQNGVDAIYGDTSEKAKKVIAFNKKSGFQVIKLMSHSHTNYYSVGFRCAINGRKYSCLEVFLRFLFSSLYCRSLWKADGQLTKFGKLAKSIKDKLKKK